MNFEISPKSSEIKSNWNDAKFYCFSLNIDGKTGWRLPTKEELNQIYESENDFEKDWYWSSTEFSGNDAWIQDFNYGYQSDFSEYFGGNFYLRAIRDIKTN